MSKNKRTNPDHKKLQLNKSYAVVEVNRSNNPSWYRIQYDGASPPQRWVAKHCGTASVQIGGGGANGGNNGGETPETCHTPGLEDSYVLALSWQPAFCESHRSKPECRIDDKKSYQAVNFTLHGLWPNKKSCGTKYGFCGEVRGKPGDFCDYPVLSLFTETRKELEQVMPSAAAGSCLQRHEWYKHGTCQVGWSMGEYFDVAVELTQEFNSSGIAYFIASRIGKTVSETEFKEKVDCAHGAGAHQRLELKCQNGNLVDVYVQLPSKIRKEDSLGDLLKQSQGQFKSNCGGQFKVDPIGF
ncbi:MAG: ribonuclease T [Gammaproteobacteria bacterium]|nr:ribonuclease T [Gammaproteobacteria bacterium]MDH5800610.1 ribonuclease T [Gammaproteobacteria bacterium]